jgi:DNA-binding transcriptional MocR family regulator
MTWRLIGPIWRLPDVTAAQRLVLLALASFTDKNGSNAYPSLATLASMACCNRSTVHRSIKSLIARQLIQATGKGRKGTIRYRVNVPLQRQGSHHATPSVSTLQHNPILKNIPFNKNPVNKGDSYINSREPQAVNIDRFSSVQYSKRGTPLPESGSEMSARVAREREARRRG